MLHIRLSLFCVSFILLPVGICVEHVTAQRQQAVFRIGGVGIEFVLKAPVAFEVAEADQVVAAPVLVEELTSALVKDLLQ